MRSHWRATSARRISSTVRCFACRAGVRRSQFVPIRMPETVQRGGQAIRHPVRNAAGRSAITMIRSRGEVWSIMPQRLKSGAVSLAELLEGFGAIDGSWVGGAN